jgi:hypothetical protein
MAGTPTQLQMSQTAQGITYISVMEEVEETLVGTILIQAMVQVGIK